MSAWALLLGLIGAASAGPGAKIQVPNAVTLGKDARFPVAIRFPEVPTDPVVVTNVGRVGELVDKGEGLWETEVLLPNQSDEVLIIVAAWDDAIGGRPALGRVLLKRKKGQPVPKGDRVAVIPVPFRVLSGSEGTVFLIVYDHRGRLGADGMPTLTADWGDVSEPKEVRAGLFLATYQPKAFVGSRFDTLKSRVGDGLIGRAELLAVGDLEHPIEVALDPPSLAADGEAVGRVKVRLLTEDGQGFPGQRLFLKTAHRPAPMEDLGGGWYEGEVMAPTEIPASGAMAVDVILGETATGEVPHRQTVSYPLQAGGSARAKAWSHPSWLPADGNSQARVLLALTDDHGNPTRSRPHVQLTHGRISRLKLNAKGQWEGIWYAPHSPELRFEKRVPLMVRADGRSLVVRSTLRLRPMKTAVADARPTSRTSVGASMGFGAVLGAGHLGTVSGPVLGAVWSDRVEETAFYTAFRPSLAILTAEVPLDFSGLDASVRILEALLPLQVEGSVRWSVGGGVSFRTGIAGGPLIAWTLADAPRAFGDGATTFDVIGALSLPFVVEFAAGGRFYTAEFRYLRGVGDLGDEDAAGVRGPVEVLSASVGYRWGLAK